MRYRELFCVFPRTLPSGRKVFYYQTYDKEGKRTNPKSTGATKAREARLYCMGLYRDGTLGASVKRTPTLAEFSVGWWDFKTCSYVKRRMARRKISMSYVRQGKRNLEANILPVFGRKRLDEITSEAIDAWMLANLDKGWSGNTVNLMFTYLKVMLGEAVRKGLIEKNPCDTVQRAGISKRKIEILRGEEVRRIFDPDSFDVVWSDELHYVLNMLAATTGMRIGEILGLKGTMVQADYVEVAGQFNVYHEYTETKTHDTRYVTIPVIVARGLWRLKEVNGESYLFSRDGGQKPISRAAVYDHFYRALASIGIDRQEQTRRGLTFHKWRHFFNTTLRMGNVADSKVRELTGHKSEAMTDHYTHFDPRTFGDVRRIQEGIALGGASEGGSASEGNDKSTGG